MCISLGVIREGGRIWVATPGGMNESIIYRGGTNNCEKDDWRVS